MSFHKYFSLLLWSLCRMWCPRSSREGHIEAQNTDTGPENVTDRRKFKQTERNEQLNHWLKKVIDHHLSSHLCHMPFDIISYSSPWQPSSITIFAQITIPFSQNFITFRKMPSPILTIRHSSCTPISSNIIKHSLLTIKSISSLFAKCSPVIDRRWCHRHVFALGPSCHHNRVHWQTQINFVAHDTLRYADTSGARNDMVHLAEIVPN